GINNARVARFAEKIDGWDGEYEPATPDVSSDSSNFARDEYLAAVEKVKDYIREGDTFQANISQRLGFSSGVDSVDIYAHLRETNPAPYMGLMAFSKFAVISSSPELLVRKKADSLTTRPIAGTRPRGNDTDEDDELRDELETSEKERAEHSILVDLARNDLGKVSEYGTVEVESFIETVPYSEVQHLESVVTGRLRDSADTVDVVRAVFPGGTVTGAPKPRTLDII
ncbi:MAG: anthranilate synthase component I family protein, partial [Halobacteria archaeon]|nr:anthranilate synthase component I family protein [Halobacteria archaeon]